MRSPGRGHTAPQVSTVGMFPVSNLRDFYESESRENVMGSGMVHDYNQKLAGDAIIYGDIVRGAPPAILGPGWDAGGGLS
jgi:hypothetical protein